MSDNNNFGDDQPDDEQPDDEHFGDDRLDTDNSRDHADAHAVDISEADQGFLQRALAADVASPPRSALTVESILAAARAGTEPAGAGLAPAAGAVPVADELAARRRRKIRSGWLAAAAAAAVVAIGVPIALNTGQSQPAAGSSASVAAGAAAPYAAATRSEKSGAPDAQSEAAAAGAESGAAAAGAAESGAAGGAESGATAGGVAAGGAADGATSPRAPGARPNSAAGTAAAGAAGTSAAGSGKADGSSLGMPDPATCDWPELPPGVDQAAVRTLGSEVIGARSILTADCLPGRVGGVVFPAKDGSRGGVTAQVVQGGAVGDCATDEPATCRRLSSGVYTGTADGNRIVWVYRDQLRIRISATTELQLSDVRLIAFADAIGALVH